MHSPEDVIAKAAAARASSVALARSSSQQRQQLLATLALQLRAASDSIAAANALDLQGGIAAGLDTAMLDRLRLDAPRISALAADVEVLAQRDDPLAECFEAQILDNGLQVHKRRVPIGVIAVIYEARPNVTIDAICLCLKTGNSVVLRGGSESRNSNRMLVALAHAALRQVGLPESAVQFIDSADRNSVLELLQCAESIDLVIPRGGAGLHALCRQHARMPVITGGIGICHLFVERSADQLRSLAVIHNAKTQRPTVCNALDVVLVDQAIAAEFVPLLVAEMTRSGVKMRLDPAALALLPEQPASVSAAEVGDFDREWLSLCLSVSVVADAAAAIAHVQQHSSGHSDGVLTADADIARLFLDSIDSAAVYWNASTRFTDGSQMGLGAEVAISTQRIHARGPMGLNALTSYKWVIRGDYHVRP